MKYLWAFLMILGFLIIPAGGTLAFTWCVVTAMSGLGLMFFAGILFVKEMERHG